MASSLSATTSASLVTKNATHLFHFSNKGISRVSFRISPNPKIRFFTKRVYATERKQMFDGQVCPAHLEERGEVTGKLCNRNTGYSVMGQVDEIMKHSSRPTMQLGLRTGQNCSTLVKAQLNEVSVDGSSNAAASSPTKSEVPPSDAADAKSSNEASPPALATEESISEFITQVSSLVKLVDSRDIVELQLKQLDCELIIRKKEALPQPASSAPVYMMHSPPPPPGAPTAPSAASATASSPALSAPPPSSSPSAPKSAKSSRPPLKCPMAGTFYRSPAPGEPPFVKVGDKVQKGQVICIIEAMKLMNDIEADQSGTIVEILVDDGKPVSVDTPLFVIEP